MAPIGWPIVLPMPWTVLIRELQACGLTQEEIASKVGITQPSVSALAAGKVKQPSFDLGNKLLKLHAKVTRKAKARA